MKPLLVILLCFVQIVLNAQDTIYKRSGDVIPARVIEINTKEISYKRENLPDGPLYILDKNEVKKIKYKTGAVDSFTVRNEPKVNPMLPKNGGLMYSYSEQIQKYNRNGLYVYQGSRISDTKAMLIATNKNFTWKNPQLTSEILYVSTNKTRQYVSGFGGLGLGALVMAGSLVYANNNPYDSMVGPVMFVNGIGIILAAQVVSINFKIKRVKHSDKAVALYNQNL